MNEFRSPNTSDCSDSISIKSVVLNLLTARGKRIRKVFRGSKKLGVRQVHRARVELRRMRAALELFSPLIKGNAVTNLDRQLRKVTRLLGPVRDLDVLLEQSLTWPEHLHSEDLVQFLLKAANRRRKIVQTCRNRLAGIHIRKILRTLGDLRFIDGATEATVEHQLRLLMSRLPLSIDFNETEIQRTHDLRKQCRQLRYQFDLVKGFLPSERALAFLKQAQSLFGQLNDSSVILERLRETNAAFLPQPLCEAIQGHEQRLVHSRLAEAIEFWNGPIGRQTMELT